MLGGMRPANRNAEASEGIKLNSRSNFYPLETVIGYFSLLIASCTNWDIRYCEPHSIMPQYIDTEPLLQGSLSMQTVNPHFFFLFVVPPPLDLESPATSKASLPLPLSSIGRSGGGDAAPGVQEAWTHGLELPLARKDFQGFMLMPSTAHTVPQEGKKKKLWVQGLFVVVS